LRKDPRVVVMERTNAIHVELPERITLVTIDVAWTRQRVILPAARRLLHDSADVISLIKPHYEADPAMLRRGVLQEEQRPLVVRRVLDDIRGCGFRVLQTIPSPIKGTGGNAELLAWLKPATID